jgi:hypothetical protein
MKFLRFAAVAVLLTLLTKSVFAADGSSGCGAGWYVFKKNSLVSSLLRASTNATFLNSIGMTFGTSNCARHDIVKKDMEGIHYAEANYHELMIEMAQGQGEYVAGFAQTLGCDESVFGTLIQQRYESHYPENGNAIQMYQSVKEQIQSDSLLKYSCGSV